MSRCRAAVITAMVIVPACSPSADWKAWVYPDKNNLAVSQTIGPFQTFEACQQSAINATRLMPDPDSADYECGFKCEPHPTFSGNVCEETRK